MRSMTGFGAGAAPLGEGRLAVEVRALNHKHTDVRLRMPPDVAEHASFFEQTIRGIVGRGRYDVSVRLEGSVGGALSIDETKLRTVYQSLQRVRDDIAPGQELHLSALASLPEVLTNQGPASEEIRRALTDAFREAEGALSQMQATEGATLGADLTSRLARLRELRSAVEEGSTDLVTHHRKRLRERVEQLLEGSGTKLAYDRLEQEVALLADKSDITEELVRLDSHFAQFGELLTSKEPVGRRLDFLLQEISREVNTVGSKSQHAKVAHLVVEMKSEVERLREQVQNVD